MVPKTVVRESGFTNAGQLCCVPITPPPPPQPPPPLGVFLHRRTQRQLLRCVSREHPCKPPAYRSVHDPLNTASGVRNAGPWDPWLPGVKKSRPFAQRTVRPLCV